MSSATKLSLQISACISALAAKVAQSFIWLIVHAL